MPDLNKLETLEDVTHWAVNHDGRIDAYWEQQHSWNDKMEARLTDFGTRLTSVERRMAYVAAAAAMFGGIIGTLLQALLKST